MLQSPLKSQQKFKCKNRVGENIYFLLINKKRSVSVRPDKIMAISRLTSCLPLPCMKVIEEARKQYCALKMPVIDVFTPSV